MDLAPLTTRPGFELPQTLLTSALISLMPELEYTIPSHIFAESCPICDEIAMGTEETEGRERFVARYPRGWVLVACKRHAEILRTTSAGGNHVVVGGQPELRSKAALRFREREKQRKQQKRATTATSAEANPTPPTKPMSTTQKHSDPCPICFSSPAHLNLDCTHTFCTPCLSHWQTTSFDPHLSSWLSNPLIQHQYPILSANLKSRFTCPMCRANLQFTKQSRRKKKMRNRRERGEEVDGEMGARSRRGGQKRRRRGREGEGVMRSEWVAPCVEASESMPVVERAQASQNDSTGME